MGRVQGIFELLRWLERVEVAGLEPLGLGHRLGDRAVYSHVQRLAYAGLVFRIYDRDAAWSRSPGKAGEPCGLPAWQVPVIWSRRGAHRPDHGLRMGARPSCG